MTDFLISGGELKRYTGRAAEVCVPEGVTRIGVGAFCGAAGVLERVILPRGLQSIGMRAFFGCGKLRAVTFPAGLASIMDAAFCGCAALETADLPEGLVLLGASAFSGCTSVQSVTLPKSLTHLKKDAFRDVRPERLTVKSTALYKNVGCLCEALPNCRAHRIAIPRPFKDAAAYFLLAGKEFMITAGAVLVAVSGVSGSFTVPDDITEIGRHAFPGGSRVVSVVLPTGVTRIGDYAFADCFNLKSIVLPETLRDVGDFAFYRCRMLSKIRLPAALCALGGHVFEGCEALKNISLPAGLQALGAYTFSGCASLRQFPVPEGVTRLEDNAFSGCTALREISLPGSLKALGASVFRDCTALKDVVLPPGLERLGEYAFRGCTALQSVSLPGDCVPETGVFYGCEALMEATLPEALTALPAQLFYGCKSLARIDLPQGVTKIGDRAFEDCAALRSVLLPAPLTSLGEYAFAGCGALRSVSLPAGLTEVADHTFSSCRGLTAAVLPEGIRRIGSGAFLNCVSLSRVELPAALEQIEDRAFSGCVSLEGVDLPRGLKGIGREAFASCARLTEIVLPPVEKMPANAFYRAGVRSFSMPEPSPLGYADGGCLISAAGNSLWCLPPQADPRYCRIPDSVKYILGNGFASCPTGCLVFPPSVLSFGYEPLRPLGKPFYFLLRSRAHAKLLKKNNEFVYLGSPAELSPAHRVLTVTNYMRALPLCGALLAECAAPYAEYIRKHCDAFYMLAAENDAAFRFFTEHGLIPAQGVDALLQEEGIAENAEKRAVLLEYKAVYYPQEASGLSGLSLEDPAFERQVKMQERRARLQAQKGVGGVVFVFSGRLDRRDLRERIERCGGIVRSAVSGNTDYVVSDRVNPISEKIRAAQALEIPVITVKRLLEMLGEAEK